MSVIQEINENPAVRERYTALANAGDTNAMMLLGAADEELGTIGALQQSYLWRHKALQAGIYQAGYLSAKVCLAGARYFEQRNLGDSSSNEAQLLLLTFNELEKFFSGVPNIRENWEIREAADRLGREARYHLTTYSYFYLKDILANQLSVYDMRVDWRNDKEKVFLLYYALTAQSEGESWESVVEKTSELFTILSGPYGTSEGVGKGGAREQMMFSFASDFAVKAIRRGLIGNGKETYRAFYTRALNAISFQPAVDLLKESVEAEENR